MHHRLEMICSLIDENKRKYTRKYSNSFIYLTLKIVGNLLSV